ncbi:aspartate carbamoyltransferase regulatory subunit [Candidatus Pacearchaeota archaeon]|jgi:aspartate carbamoyltransferase regulatory subunit|nr:aspartate carbamoyltransferase regulatory subunit [Candidatus Pacearchaeota archaeon]
MNNEKIIGYIQNGIVVDHIPVGKVWEIVHILGIDKDKLNGGRISLGEGYESKRLCGRKGILKVEGITLSDLELNYIALIAEGANVSFIQDGIVKNKINVKIPSKLEGLIACPNEGCVSRDIFQKANPIINYDYSKEEFKCHYCNRNFNKSELELLI